MCEASTSTHSASRSRQARQSTIPSEREKSETKPTSGGNGSRSAAAEARAALAAQAAPGQRVARRRPRPTMPTMPIWASTSGWTASWERSGEPSVTTPDTRSGRVGRQRLGEHAAAALADDHHPVARGVGQRLQPLLDPRARGRRAVHVGADPRRLRPPPGARAASASSSPSEPSPARKPGMSRTPRAVARRARRRRG